MEATNKKDIIVAADIGLKRIGVAKSIYGIPVCLNPILRKNRNQAAKELQELLEDTKANVLVVGIPKTQDTEQEDSILAMQRRIKHFIGLLEIPSSLEVIFVDEAFSSKEALDKLEDKKMRKKANSKNGSLDSQAALVILERFLMRQK